MMMKSITLAAALAASMAAATFTPAAAQSAWIAPSGGAAQMGAIHYRIRNGGDYVHDRGRHWRRHDRRHHHRRHHHRGWGPPVFFGFGMTFGDVWGPDYPPPAYYPPRANVLPRRHVIWCDRHYRTYRRSDNTFIPRIGVRAICRSPYWP